MNILKGISTISILTAAALTAHAAAMLSVTNMNALEGLAPMTALGETDAGKAALASNFTVTGDIQSGAAKQPLLLSFPDQQQQALRDAFITGVAYELADGLGNKLGPAYQATTSHTSMGDCKTLSFTSILPAVGRLIGFANATTHADSDAAKFFFANETRDGTEPVSGEAKVILTHVNGTTNVFGVYKTPAGSAKVNPYGNSRPFQTEPHLTEYGGKDFCGSETSNADNLQHLAASPAYPSGHTVYDYMESLLLALLVPERYQQMVTRAAEYGNDRIVLGAHYAMDVLGGRTLAEYDLAQLLANKTGYVVVKRGAVEIGNFRQALAVARADLTAALEKDCGGKIVDCAAQDQSRFADPAKNRAFYEATQTYGLPVVFANNAEGTEDVAKLAPEAGYLLTAAFPSLTLAQADAILTLTEGPGGGFLDNGSAFGVYSRLDLYKAAEQAAALSARGK
ncbi:MAG: phosphatase PAP2 family protein [Steroidobacteraceae bacterium]